LPSRRSTEHQRGAFSIRLSGQVRSSSTRGRNGRYFSKGIFWGFVGCGGMAGSFRPFRQRNSGSGVSPETKNPLPGGQEAGDERRYRGARPTEAGVRRSREETASR